MSETRVDWQAEAKNVVVFRALNLGDMLCAVPALRALRHALPEARITLVGLKSAEPVMHYFSAYLDELVEFPGDPAFPEQGVRHEHVPEFYRQMRAQAFDLALQMHGSGQQSNAIVQAMTPARWVGFVPQKSDAVPGQLLLWPDHLHEVHRYLALLQHVGFDVDDDTLEFPVEQSDTEQADALIAAQALIMNRLVFIHPGARLASRRWPLERYAMIARVLTEAGWQVAVTGSMAEIDLARALQSHAGRPVVNLCGMTSLGVLASLLQRGRLLICNDTGVSHVAASVNLPSIVIACGSDVVRWAPLDARRHTVVYAPMDCRPCAYDVCPIGHSCALEVEPDHVLAHAFRHLGTGEHR